MDLHDPETYARVYDDHSRGVYRAAFRILGNFTLKVEPWGEQNDP